MSSVSGTSERPKAWIDENNVVALRDDLSREEAEDLYKMLGAAFNAGVKSGYAQGKVGSHSLTAGLGLTPSQRSRIRVRLSRLGLGRA